MTTPMNFVVVGYRGCGKSALIRRISAGPFLPIYSMTVVPIVRETTLKGNRISIVEIPLDLCRPFPSAIISSDHGRTVNMWLLCVDGSSKLSIRKSARVHSILERSNANYITVITKSDIRCDRDELSIFKNVMYVSNRTGVGIDELMSAMTPVFSPKTLGILSYAVLKYIGYPEYTSTPLSRILPMYGPLLTRYERRE